MRERARAARRHLSDELRSSILAGNLQPGDRLPPERTLSAEFGTTRKTVREALEELSREGLIVRRASSGSFVATTFALDAPPDTAPSVSPLDAIEARLVLEPSWYDLVVARATDQDFARMRKRLEGMTTAANHAAFQEAGYAFRLEIVRATRNPLLMGIYEMLIAARAKAGWSAIKPLHEWPDQRREHTDLNRRIYEALHRRDAAAAAELSRRHLTSMITTVAAFPRVPMA